MSAALRREEGFSLVELLVAMTMFLLVLGAVLTLFDGFQAGVDRTTRLTDAEQAARSSMGRVVRSLRNAGAPPSGSATPVATILRAQPNDVLVRTTDWPGESRVDNGTHLVRFCLDGASGTLRFDGLKNGGTVVPQPDPGTACPSTAAGWTHQALAHHLVNSATDPVFDLTAGADGVVRAAHVHLAVEGARGTPRSRPTHLRSAATLRGAIAPAVANDDIDCRANPDGSTLLSLGADVGPGELDLSSPDGIPVGVGRVLINASAGATVAVKVTNALGLETLLFKNRSTCT